MLKVHRRLLDLLNQFLKNESVLNRSILSKALGVSTKTIQKDIRELNGLMKPYGAVVESCRGNGYKLRIDDQGKFRRFHQCFFQFDSSRIPSTQEERITYVLTKLLTGKSYIKLEELAKDLYVSKSTVHLLMKDVTELLLPYNLMIERRPYHGIRVKGDEISLRSCISQYLLPRDVHVPLLENEYESVGISDLHRIRDTVLKCIEQTNVYLSDLELDNLVIHIAIAIRRLKEQHYIQSFRLNLREIAETREYEIAENITGYLEKELHISFPKEEIFYIAIHLLGTSITTRGLGSLQDVLGDPVHSILEEILQTVRHRMGVDFKQDREFMFGLGLHIKAVMNRMKYGLNIRNPLLKDIKTSYPYAFELALTASDILSRHLGAPIHEDETGYLAIHFGAALNRSNNTRPSVKHGNTQDLQMLYDLLYNMMNNAETVHQLVKAEDVKNFVNILLKTSVT
ncbi:BglG family transcription antiterminator [Kroppenstedtia eburnea]|uniref:BglG family transcription antiterminator n=1 Tax=Kroppenstedtia eburnea TaxID=714067 RepID=UPI003641C9A7